MLLNYSFSAIPNLSLLLGRISPNSVKLDSFSNSNPRRPSYEINRETAYLYAPTPMDRLAFRKQNVPLQVSRHYLASPRFDSDKIIINISAFLSGALGGVQHKPHSKPTRRVLLPRCPTVQHTTHTHDVSPTTYSRYCQGRRHIADGLQMRAATKSMETDFSTGGKKEKPRRVVFPLRQIFIDWESRLAEFERNINP